MKSSTYYYQIGGSLPEASPTYVMRKADNELYKKLKSSEFCYILNSRQMGKSSLLVRTVKRLSIEGVACATIDISDIGSKQISLEQWYGGVAYKLTSNFNLLDALEFMTWWQDRESISPVHRLGELIETVLLQQVSQRIVIFIDEIDSVLSVNESLEDFFALIRSCYNKRSQNPHYDRLTFALLGVATPSDLISDRTRTPFNIGHAIDLSGFQPNEVQPLVAGLADILTHPQEVLHQILHWTGGQPFLTQKLCQLVRETGKISPEFLPQLGNEAEWVERLIKTAIIHNWESRDEPAHLRTVRDRLLRNPQRASRLLGCYQKLLQFQAIPADDSPEQTELRLSGLVRVRDGKLTVSNPIYAAIFNSNWLEKSLFDLRPYAEALAAWLGSDRQDTSRLLRGKALQDARDWAKGKNLSDRDYQFLAASQEAELTQFRQNAEQNQAQIQQLYRQKELLEELTQEQNRRKITEAKLRQHRQNKAQIITGWVSGVMAVSAFLLGVFWVNKSIDKTHTKLNGVALLSQALIAENQPELALIESLEAAQQLKALIGVNSATQFRVALGLHQAIYGLIEPDRLLHPHPAVTLEFTPKGQGLVTAIHNTVTLWNRDRQVALNLPNIPGPVNRIAISPDGQLIAVATTNHPLQFWTTTGEKLPLTLPHSSPITDVSFSPKAEAIATAEENTVKIWRVTDGKLLQTWRGHLDQVLAVMFSPNGKTLASASGDRRIFLRRTSDGKLIHLLEGHGSRVVAIRFSPDGQLLASASDDGTVRLWRETDGKLLSILHHSHPVTSLSFHPDSQTLATGTSDGNINLWNRDGSFLTPLRGHQQAITHVSWSPEGGELASTSDDGTAMIWNLELKDLVRQGCQLLGDRSIPHSIPPTLLKRCF
ncbi:AAA-like domain-containing protein [Oscillatoria acuminata]|uniref:WD40 repeat-containing protein n=1 Tax=Oscillatoria acuminata PCC 6304 TaxID=56110 RepID=K9TF95_9CYAN|nr:AAA-like domain-containing protein [Oscillatoria acuminata]AFY81547.1 WD40 repeat-containing protein [Oscillatoria acuminata PCC 6304]